MHEIGQAWSTLRIKDNFSQLTYSVQTLMNEYYQIVSSDGDNLPRLETLANEMLKVSSTATNELEISLAKIELSILYSRQRSFKKAYQQIEDVIKLLKEHPPRNEISYQTFAAAYWLLGCLEISRGSSRSEVLKCWQRSLNLYEKLSCHQLMYYTNQYKFHSRKMRDTIHTFILDRTVPTYRKAQFETISSQSAPPPEPGLQLTLPNFSLFKPVTLISSPTKILEVFNTIPAGPLTELEDPLEAMETVILEEQQTIFEINKQDYQFFHLRDDQQTYRLHSQQKYIILKVEGDSMNLAHIEDGDYILLRLQNSAQHEDIVAAQITQVNQNPQATLKRFEWHGQDIYLKAESNNPNNESYKLHQKEIKQKLTITGVAIGVFKPCNTWTREIK